MRSSRLLISFALAGATCLAYVAGGAEAGSATAPPAGLTVATGHVVAAMDGGPAQAVSGADVTVWWVSGESTAKPGDMLTVESVGTARTDADGAYTVSVSPTAEMRRAAATNGGWVNLNIGTVSDRIHRADSTTISRRLVDGAWKAAYTGHSGASQRAGGPESPDQPASMGLVTDFVLGQDSPVAASSRAAGRSPVYCGFATTATPQRTTSIVEFHNAPNADAKWTYGQTADSDIDGAIDYSGDGGWSVHGTVHMNNSDGAQVYRNYNDQVKVNNYGRTDFKFLDGQYQWMYGDATPYPGQLCEGTSIPIGTKTKNATQWVGGVSTNSAAGSEYIGCSQSPQSDNRTSYPAGSGLTRQTNNAAKIGVAVDVGPITVGAKSGYSTSMVLNWDSKRGSGIWLCGTNSGPTTAGVIHAQNRP